MSQTVDDLVYSQQTAQGYRYYFHPRHHGAGSSSDARWKSEITRPDEFGIFRDSANADFADVSGNLYGLMKIQGKVIDIGTQGEQIAKFWKASTGSPWHGFPCWAILSRDYQNRRGQQYRPPKSVLEKMQEQKLITLVQCRRLSRGDRI